MVAGDIWIDNANNKLYFFDGTDLVLVGPEYDAGQGQTGFEVSSVIDISARERVVLKIWIGGTLFGVITKEEFRLAADNKIPGFPDDPDDIVIPPRQLYRQGFNLVDTDFVYRGTSEKTLSLIDTDGVAFTSADFLPTGSNGETTGSLKIKNSAGLSVGIADTEYMTLKIVGTTTTLETQQSGTDIALRTRQGNSFSNALKIISASNRVGVFVDDPQYTMDISGSLHTTGHAVIDGDLTVNGEATYVNVTNIQVEDKNIELGQGDGVLGTDTDINGGGIILKSSDGDKSILFDSPNSNFDTNLNFNLESGFTYRINNIDVLSASSLGIGITSALGLAQVGTLVDLQVDNIELDGTTISTTGAGLTIDSSGDVSVSNNKITDVNNPTAAQDAATKNYVDTQIDSEPVVFTLDTTGLTLPTTGNPYTDVIGILQTLFPAAEKTNGTQARIHCTSYTNVSVTGIDVQSAMSKSYLSVLTDDSTAQSVVQDVNFSPVNANAQLTPTRQTMTFEVSGGVWTWSGTA
jgi:hypothetical protein